MKKALLALSLIVGTSVLVGCSSGNDQATQASSAQDDLEKAIASATTGAAPARRATASSEIGPGALKIVNKTAQTVQVRVTGVNNYDWENDNRPDHIPPQGINKAVLAPGGSTLAPRLDRSATALSHPFNVDIIGSNPRNTSIAGIRLDVCLGGWTSNGEERGGEGIVAVENNCTAGTRDFPQAGDYILRVVNPESITTARYGTPPGVPTVLTITSKSNPTW